MVGWPFFSEPYFGLALMSQPSSSNSVIARFLPVVMAPQPPTECMRTVMAPLGSRLGFSVPRTRQFLDVRICLLQILLMDLVLRVQRIARKKSIDR